MSFQRACARAEVPVGTVVPVVLGDTEIAVVSTEEGVFAILDRCSHAEVPLSEGDVEGSTIECYLHGSRFDLRTGAPLELPAVAPVPIYPVRLDGGDILIDPENPIRTQEP